MDVHIQEELNNNGHDNVTQSLPLQQKKTNTYPQLYKYTELKIILIQNDIEQYEDKSNNIIPKNLENETYSKKHGFTIIKKWLMRHKNENIEYRSFGCKFGNHHQPKKQVDINKHRNHKSKRQQLKFSALSILDCDLANTIQKYKVKTDIVYNAFQLLKTLIQYKSNNPRWYIYIEFQFDEENRLI
ncbi:hypothetical protein Glove_115g3 [Diversispora epigaea]|uniref:Uncharacterized protein n=1 Tax=Diversispora epigaea TaxID=1348612 RepID=A0A397J1B8_9GLOM|nr:hypothetical protein Glove_115g3 [Diversispora epigaea]